MKTVCRVSTPLAVATFVLVAAALTFWPASAEDVKIITQPAPPTAGVQVITTPTPQPQQVTVVKEPITTVTFRHEAVTDPLVTHETIVVKTAPPEPRGETPDLTTKPAGDAVWVPGYWWWDSSASKYVWVPGVWRKAPSGLVWHPGKWISTNGEWTWVSGYWGRSMDTTAVIVKEAPPEPREETLTVAPGADYVWIPGHWTYEGGKYTWTSGRWERPSNPGMLWVSGHWEKRPEGYVYIAGHWDYPPESRVYVVERRTEPMTNVIIQKESKDDKDKDKDKD